MSEPIQVGDLVAVVHWAPCGCFLGNVGTVIELSQCHGEGCYGCGSLRLASAIVPAAVVRTTRILNVPLSWLKRIDPLSELESEKRDKEVEA